MLLISLQVKFLKFGYESFFDFLVNGVIFLIGKVFGRNLLSGNIKIRTSVFSAPEGINLSTQKPKR